MGGLVFISYSHQDHAYVGRLVAHLGGEGIDAWTDEGIEHGAYWAQTIEENIRACIAFIPVMSVYSREAAWVRREILLAQQLSKLILPLLLSGDRFLELLDVQDENVTGGALPSARFTGRLRTHRSQQLPRQPPASAPPPWFVDTLTGHTQSHLLRGRPLAGTSPLPAMTRPPGSGSQSPVPQCKPSPPTRPPCCL